MKDLWHGLPSRSSDEDLTAPNTVKKPIKKGRYQGQRCIQAIMVVIPAVVEGVALLAAIVPFGLHRWNMHKWTVAHSQTHVPQPSEEEIPLTVLLPVWNEARIIEKKLDDLAKQSVSFSLLLIDSASDDRTVEYPLKRKYRSRYSCRSGTKRESLRKNLMIWPNSRFPSRSFSSIRPRMIEPLS